MSPKEVDAWLSELALKRDAERLEEPSPTRDITERHLEMIAALKECTFLPASFDKRFVQSMASKALGDTLTVRQSAFLAKIFHRYRRQHRSAE